MISPASCPPPAPIKGRWSSDDRLATIPLDRQFGAFAGRIRPFSREGMIMLATTAGGWSGLPAGHYVTAARKTVVSFSGGLLAAPRVVRGRPSQLKGRFASLRDRCATLDL
jgi:hypothetical protein